MTCREKLSKEHPDLVDDIYAGGCSNCPSTYGYLVRPDYCGLCDNDCYLCWGREIPEESVEEKMTCRNLFYQKHADMEHEAAVKLFRDSCPDVFGYAEKPEYCIGTNINGACTRCWEREAETKVKDEDKMEPIIKDSGNRREFSSGAVRDMQEGKGRCDLMPLEVVARFLDLYHSPAAAAPIVSIAQFHNDGDMCNTKYLYDSMYTFCMNAGYNLSHSTMFLEVAKHFEEGAKKYGENNWQKGIPVNCYIDSAVRHYLKWLRGDKDEPHDRAFVWNLMCCIWEVDYREKDN